MVIVEYILTIDGINVPLCQEVYESKNTSDLFQKIIEKIDRIKIREEVIVEIFPLYSDFIRIFITWSNS